MMKQDKVAILVKKAALEFDKLSNGALGPYDLTISQYKVMKYLYEEEDKGVRIVDLESYYSMAHPTAIGIVQNLEKKGLVTYVPNPMDGRSHFIVPTEKALADRPAMDRIGAELEAKFTESLTVREHQQLVSLLRKLLDIPENE